MQNTSTETNKEETTASMEVTTDTSEKNQTKSKISSILFYAVLIILVIFILFTKRYYIQTGSMEPSHPVGSLVFILPTENLNIGDVGAYTMGSNVVIHRVVDITPEGYKFKGDSNGTPDGETITSDRIIGKEILKISIIAPIARKILGYE